MSVVNFLSFGDNVGSYKSCLNYYKNLTLKEIEKVLIEEKDTFDFNEILTTLYSEVKKLNIREIKEVRNIFLEDKNLEIIQEYDLNQCLNMLVSLLELKTLKVNEVFHNFNVYNSENSRNSELEYLENFDLEFMYFGFNKNFEALRKKIESKIISSKGDYNLNLYCIEKEQTLKFNNQSSIKEFEFLVDYEQDEAYYDFNTYIREINEFFAEIESYYENPRCDVSIFICFKGKKISQTPPPRVKWANVA